MGHPKSAPSPHSDPVGELVFEHPLAERMRSFLRMEAVLAESRERMAQSSPASGRATLAGLLELSALTERGELKREILTELDRQRVFLARIADSDEVDSKRLKQALYALEQVQKTIETLPERLGQNLKGNEFLASVRSRSAIPGGTCAFDL
ncbi:MAG: cell division protein ZapD, partial [Gammaproteobacteria bacterium]